MFIGYLSSFFIALLLSFFYLGYAATGVLGQIGDEIKEEIQKKQSEDTLIPSENATDIFTIISSVYVADILDTDTQTGCNRFPVDTPFLDDDIPVAGICPSICFLRPPPIFS